MHAYRVVCVCVCVCTCCAVLYVCECLGMKNFTTDLHVDCDNWLNELKDVLP